MEWLIIAGVLMGGLGGLAGVVALTRDILRERERREYSKWLAERFEESRGSQPDLAESLRRWNVAEIAELGDRWAAMHEHWGMPRTATGEEHADEGRP